METVYEGVWLHEVLKKAGAPQGSELAGQSAGGLRYWRKRRTGIRLCFSLGELDPSFIDNEILLADTANGKALFGAQGRFRLVVPKDKPGARSVRNADEARSGAGQEIKAVKARPAGSVPHPCLRSGGGPRGRRLRLEAAQGLPAPCRSGRKSDERRQGGTGPLPVLRQAYVTEREAVLRELPSPGTRFHGWPRTRRGNNRESHPRGSMSLVNVAYARTLTWANPELSSLEEQALVPDAGEAPIELGMKGQGNAVPGCPARGSAVSAALFGGVSRHVRSVHACQCDKGDRGLRAHDYLDAFAL